MLSRGVMMWVALALSLPGASCSGGGATNPIDAEPPAPVDATGDTARVPMDAVEVLAPPPAVHEVPIGAADLTFHVGPHVMHTTHTSVALVWESEETGDTRVEYGPTGSYGGQIEGAAGTMHEVVIPALQPATLYHYRACTGERCTADLTFSTAPLPGQEFRFAVYGDSRSDPQMHGAVIQSMITEAPALVLNVGDIVASGARPEYKTEHFDPSRQLGHYVPLYVSIGNHEWKEADGVAGEPDVPNFREYMAFPEVAGHRVPELSYAFTFGDAFFIALDNTLDGGDLFFGLGGFEPPLAAWLREAATSDAAKSATWRFAFMHYPPASPCHEEWTNLTATREDVIPLLRENGFHALFAGHVHDYERQDWDGFPVIIAGGGGAGMEDISLCTNDLPELVEIASVHHHLTIDLGADTAHIRAVDLDGAVFDQLTIPRK
jgi:hypothetical protein